LSHGSVDVPRAKKEVNYLIDQPLHTPVLQYVPGNRKIKTGGFITAITSSIQN
jgi:hypothetical protein